jgi:cellulose synthase/poly-beta-1,6-N-acetylglucosamine synthase-like glycosyltransferase
MEHTNVQIKAHRGISLAILSLLFSVFCCTFYQTVQADIWIAWLLFPMQMAALLMSLYTFFPALLYSIFYKKIEKHYTEPIKMNDIKAEMPQFILLTPARNEALTLPSLITSIKQLDYPVDKVKAIVIADNCTDNTASVARKAGAIVYERHPEMKSDKTQALHYAAELFSNMPDLSPDTIVMVVDADCRLRPDYLKAIAEQFLKNDTLQVIQSHRVVSNFEETKTSLLDAAAEALRQRVNSGTRHLLGLENYLYGLGTGFKLPIFVEMTQLDQLVFADDKAWKAHLATRHIPIGYAPKAIVEYEAYAKEEKFLSQRLRWVTGHYDMIKRFFIPMLWQGITRLNISQLDFSASIITLPRSFLLVLCSICCVIATFFPTLSIFPAWIWASTILAYVLYAALGLYLIGSTRYYILLSGISLIVGIFRANCLSLVRRGSQTWGIERQ